MRVLWVLAGGLTGFVEGGQQMLYVELLLKGADRITEMAYSCVFKKSIYNYQNKNDRKKEFVCLLVRTS